MSLGTRIEKLRTLENIADKTDKSPLVSVLSVPCPRDAEKSEPLGAPSLKPRHDACRHYGDCLNRPNPGDVVFVNGTAAHYACKADMRRYAALAVALDPSSTKAKLACFAIFICK